MFRSFARSTRQFLTAIVLLLVALVVTEIVLQVKSPPPSATVTSRVSEDTQILLAPSSTTHHELLRLSSHQLSGEAVLKTNSFGLRGHEPVQPKPESLLRIVVLGDETILSPELAAEETVPTRLQEFLAAATQGSGTDVEVINAGVPGYCPLLSRLQLQHQLQQLKPDIVVLHFDMNDVADDAVYRRALKTNEGQQICVNHMLAPDRREPNSLLRLLRSSALLRLIQQETGLAATHSSAQGFASLNDRYRWTTASRVALRLQIEHALEPIQQLAQFAERSGFRLLVSSSPTPWQVATADDFPVLAEQMGPDVSWPLIEDIPYQILTAISARSSVAFCNAATKFRAFSEPAKLFQNDSPGLSRYGAALYAREIASMLVRDERFAASFSRRPVLSSRTPQRN